MEYKLKRVISNRTLTQPPHKELTHLAEFWAAEIYAGVEQPAPFLQETRKTMLHAKADVGVRFTAYNLRRILNLIGKETLRRIFVEFFIVISLFLASLEQFWRWQKYQSQNQLENLPSLQRKYLLI